jgi:dihydroflavonol-4-reductase
MRALVTGATGCVGANIVEALLARGYEVRAMRRTTSRLDALTGLDPEFVVGDVLDYASLCHAMEDCDFVFHAAAVSQYWRNEPDLIYAVNVTGTGNVLRAARAQGVQRVVVTSSVAALGVPRRYPRQLIDERATFNIPPSRFHYGHSKVLVEAEVQRAVNPSSLVSDHSPTAPTVPEGLDVVIVNPVSVIGQRDVYFVGGEILRVMRRGLGWVAPPGGMGVVSAKAVGLGHVLAAERGRIGERYILNGENIAHRQLMNLVAQVVGARRPIMTLPRWGITLFVSLLDILGYSRRYLPFVRRFPLPSAEQVWLSAKAMYFDGRKAVRDLGFPQVSASKAVQEAWDWYVEQGIL